MQIRIDSVSDIKTGQYGVSSKIKAGNESYYANEDATPYIGHSVDAEISEKKSAKGNIYKIAKILGIAKVQQSPAESAHDGHALTWEQYETIIKDAHRLISELEPDGYGGPINGGEDAPQLITIDRSRARVAFLSTIVIAASNGKIAVGDDDPGIPF